MRAALAFILIALAALFVLTRYDPEAGSRILIEALPAHAQPCPEPVNPCELVDCSKPRVFRPWDAPAPDPDKDHRRIA